MMRRAVSWMLTAAMLFALIPLRARAEEPMPDEEPLPAEETLIPEETAPPEEPRSQTDRLSRGPGGDRGGNRIIF